MEIILTWLLERTRIDRYLWLPAFVGLAALLLMHREITGLLFSRRMTEAAVLQRISHGENRGRHVCYAHFLTERQRLLRMEVNDQFCRQYAEGTKGSLTHRGRRLIRFETINTDG